MKLNEFAKILDTPVAEIIRRAKRLNLKVDYNTPLTPEQIAQLKKVEEQPIARPQLPGQSEPRQHQEQMVPSEPSTPENGNQSPINNGSDIASVQQNAVTQASAARQAQQQHILQTRLQQASGDGLYEGVVEGLTHQKSRIEGLMLVTDAAFQSEQSQREKHGELMASLLRESSDFLTRHPGAAQTYSESAKIGAATTANIMQTINNLRNS
ncbi:MAG TPA: hypothetical protein VK211_24320 [Kamptonema sp.]|nr:hypothetical protein [Kamptonema sp.]